MQQLYHQHLLTYIETSPQLSCSILRHLERFTRILVLVRKQTLRTDHHVAQLPILQILRLFVQNTTHILLIISLYFELQLGNIRIV